MIPGLDDFFFCWKKSNNIKMETFGTLGSHRSSQKRPVIVKRREKPGKKPLVVKRRQKHQNGNQNLGIMKAPLPILAAIVGKLASRDVINLCQVSKFYEQNICRHEKLWQGLVYKKFGTLIPSGVVGYLDYYYDRKVFQYRPDKKDPSEIALPAKLKYFDASRRIGFIDVNSNLIIERDNDFVSIGKADKYYNYGLGGFFLRDGDLFEYTTISGIDYGRKMKNVDIFGRNETTWYLRS